MSTAGMAHRIAAGRAAGIAAGPKRAAIEQAKVWWLERYTLGELRSWPPLL